MTRGRKPKPTALKLLDDNPGKRRINGQEPKRPASLPDCPAPLSAEAKQEWARLAKSLNDVGLLTQVDRATMAGYCQCYGRWVEAELKLAETPSILRMPSGYIQQSPWLTIAHKQLELMAKYMAELGLTPASRSRLAIQMHTLRQATPILPIRKNGRHWTEDCPAARARNETLRATRHHGRASWKPWTAYHARSRIEAKMRCLKAFGEPIAARHPDRQTAKIQIRIALMNRFNTLGTAEIVRVA